jgi:putative endonuclease
VKHYVYIIQSEAEPDQYYSGLCADVAARLAEHNSGKSPHTSKYKPWRIVFHCWFDKPHNAANFERYLKSGPGRAFASKRLR